LIEQSAQYRKDHKEKISTQKVHYYQKHKVKITQYYLNNKDKRKQKITCECGSILQISNNPRHIRSEKHKRWVENNETVEVSNDDFNNLHAYI